MIVKTRANFPFKVSTKYFTQNDCLQESGWYLYPSSSPDCWTNAFPMKASHKNFNVRSYYAEDTMVLYFKFNILFIWQKIAAVSA